MGTADLFPLTAAITQICFSTHDQQSITTKAPSGRTGIRENGTCLRMDRVRSTLHTANQPRVQPITMGFDLLGKFVKFLLIAWNYLINVLILHTILDHYYPGMRCWIYII